MKKDVALDAGAPSSSAELASSELIAPQHRAAYRPEIDGLRAIAVSAVLLYHASATLAPAGFLGVDVFFVISGYLITKILSSDLEKGQFSILRFYDRRIRRIMPALLVVTLLSIIPAYFLMIPDDLENFGQSLFATIMFSNNILLYITSGYFESATEFKPLVHSWSLGVEEQYYLLIPVFLWIVYKIHGVRSALAATLVLSVVSFGICLWAVNADQNANFYLLPSRAWELGAGGGVALAEPWLKRKLAGSGFASFCASVGLLMIVIPMAILTVKMPMPGWPTLVPVLGTCLVILFANAGEPAGRLLATRPFVSIGLISYSAYLIHQPVFAFARISSLDPPPTTLLLALLVPVLLLSYASWRWIERPFRRKDAISTKTVFGTVSVGAAIALFIGLLFHFTSGFYRSWPELASHDTGFGAGQNIAYNMAPERYLDRPFPAAATGPKVMVLGDSFARDFINMGLESGALAGADISLAHVPECSPAPLPDEVVERIRAANLIVWSSSFGAPAARCIAERVTGIRRLTSTPVVVMGTKSFAWNNNAVMLLDPAERYAYRAKPDAEVVAANAYARKLFPGAGYIDLLGMLSDEHGRVPTFTPDHRFISQDRSHLTQAGARYVGALVFRHPALQAILHPGSAEPLPVPQAPDRMRL